MKNKSEKHMTYFRIVDSFAEKECPVCFLLKKSINNFFDSFIYENVLDGEISRKLEKSKGFCNKHAYDFIKYGDALAIAITYQPIIYEILNEIQEDKAYFKKLLDKKGICPACERRSDSEKHYIDAFISYIGDEDFIEKYKKSSGLCIPHFIEILSNCRNKKDFEIMVQMQEDFLTELSNELKEIKRKNDYRFSKEPWGKEKDAWIRAVRMMVGYEGYQEK